jgi:hypothetical protein
VFWLFRVFFASGTWSSGLDSGTDASLGERMSPSSCTQHIGDADPLEPIIEYSVCFLTVQEGVFCPLKRDASSRVSFGIMRDTRHGAEEYLTHFMKSICTAFSHMEKGIA